MAGSFGPRLVDPLTGQESKVTSSAAPELATVASSGPARTTFGAPGPAPTPAQTAAPAAQAQAAPTSPGAGTGYVNLSRVLGANLGAGAGLKSAADTKAGNELKDRTDAQDSYRWKLNDATQKSSLAGGLLNGGAQGTPASVDSKLFAGGNGLTGSLKGLDFADKFSRDPNSQNMQDLQGLGNSASAGRVLAKDAGVTGGYGPKLSALDSLIYGGNGADATKNSVSGAAANYGSEKANAAQGAKELNSNADWARTTADTTAAANRQFLTDMAPGYGADSQQGQALASLLGDPNLKFGVAGPGLASMGANQGPPTLTPVGTGAALAAPPKQQFGEGAQNTHDPAPGVDATLMRQRLNNLRAKQGR